MEMREKLLKLKMLKEGELSEVPVFEGVYLLHMELRELEKFRKRAWTSMTFADIAFVQSILRSGKIQLETRIKVSRHLLVLSHCGHTTFGKLDKNIVSQNQLLEKHYKNFEKLI